MQVPKRSNIKVNRRLHSTAEAQAGFFTAKQAKKAGFSESSHTYHVQAGNWIREYRGIYRLPGFPAALHPELVRWHLWAMDRVGRAQGVYSYFTALDLYLRPEETPELHMTVPKGFRRTGATPEGLTLHYANLAESDIAERKGYRLTTPLRTILDLAAGDLAPGDLAAANGMPRAELSKALMGILERGVITREQVESARIPEMAQLQLEELLRSEKR